MLVCPKKKHGNILKYYKYILQILHTQNPQLHVSNKFFTKFK